MSDWLPRADLEHCGRVPNGYKIETKVTRTMVLKLIGPDGNPIDAASVPMGDDIVVTRLFDREVEAVKRMVEKIK